MGWAVVMVIGPPDRNVYIDDNENPSGRTGTHLAAQEGRATFRLKASSSGPAKSVDVDVVNRDPPMVIDLS